VHGKLGQPVPAEALEVVGQPAAEGVRHGGGGRVPPGVPVSRGAVANGAHK
jgi:hypothetical protein